MREKAGNSGSFRLLIYVFTLGLLILNGLIFNNLRSYLRPDLYVEKVSRVNKDCWEIKAAATKPLPGEQVEIEILFGNDMVKKETWDLQSRHFTQIYENNLPIVSISITAPEEIDWNRENSTFTSCDIWSREVHLATIPAAADRYLTPADGGSLYLLYPVPSIDPERTDYTIKHIANSIQLEKFIPAVNGTREKAVIFSSDSSRLSCPFIYPLNSPGEPFLAVVGWNTASKINNAGSSPEGEDAAGLYQLHYHHDQYICKELSEGCFASKEKIYNSTFSPESGDWYLLTGGLDAGGERFNWSIYHYNRLKLIKKTRLPLQQPHPPTQVIPRLGRIIPDKMGYSLFWIANHQGEDGLFYQQVSFSGKANIPLKKIMSIQGLRYTRERDFQIISVGEGRFQLGWIEFTRGIRVTRKLNHIFIGSIEDLEQIKSRTVENTSSFHLTRNPAGNIDLYTATGNGSFNTDIFQYKYNADFQQIHPRQLIINSRSYEEYPDISYTSGGYHLLSWIRDKKDRFELFVSTTDPSLKLSTASRSPVIVLSDFVEQATIILISIVIGTAFCFFSNILPLLTLIVYNYLGRYRKCNFVFWLTALLLLFPVKLYNLSVIIKWSSPLMSHIYQLQIILLLITFSIITLYFYKIKNKGHGLPAFANRIITVWLLTDSYYLFFSYLKKIYLP